MFYHGEKIVLATSNKGKIAELTTLLTDVNVSLVALSQFTKDDVEETGRTFIENAIIKARYACEVSQLPAMADDSGLVVDALGGKPGIFSARFAGAPADSEANMDLLLEAMNGIPEEKRTAHFYCVIAFLRHENDPEPVICQGKWSGVITTERQGSRGFGYDPLFFVPEQGCTAAELPSVVKSQLSHRGQAMAELKRQFFS